MAIPLAETLVTLGTSLQSWCQLQETWVPFADAISLQPPVVPVVGIGVIKTLSYSCCFGVGVDVPEGIQHPSVVVRSMQGGSLGRATARSSTPFAQSSEPVAQFTQWWMQ